MRMWMVPVSTMCRKHLLGEHVETHMLVGSMRKGVSLHGYYANNLIEPSWLVNRHEALADEMVARGYNHASPMDEEEVRLMLLDLPPVIRSARVNRDSALADLHNRCPDCRARYEKDLTNDDA